MSQVDVSRAVLLPGFVRLGRDLCGDLDPAERREWWVSNGRGAYAAGTVAGSLSRRYHGLLVAPLAPTLGQFLVAAKADATLRTGGQAYPLFTNHWQGGAVDPQGLLRIEGFRLHGRMPVWRYGVAGHLLESCIWMEHGRDSTWVAYHLLDHPAQAVELEIALIVNYRGHHQVTQDHRPELQPRLVAADELQVDLPDGHALHIRGGMIEPESVWLERFYLAREHERGLEHCDNHLRLATLSLALRSDAWVGFNVAVDAPSTSTLAASRTAFLQREQVLLADADDALGSASTMPDWLAQLVLAADSFVFERPLSDGERGVSVIAGYPWFGDWGRDTMIALPGLTLATGRAPVARQILETFAGFVDRGMLPNRFPGDGEAPEYNTVDAALWFVEAWRAYVEATGDTAALAQVFPALQAVMHHYRDGTRYGIGMDPDDHLIRCGEPGTQLTWMDAKVQDWVVTPRHGKPVEINALWYNALCTVRDFAESLAIDSAPYAGLAGAVKVGFQRFVRSPGGGLYDVIDTPQGPHDASVRPNQIFAVSLPHSPLDVPEQRAVVRQCADQLVCNLGLRSLAPGHEDYVGIYQGGVRRRDGAYHQGTVWAWLLGHFVTAEYRLERDRTLAYARLEGVADHLRDAALGQLSEIFDGDPPHRARGAPAQAWSVATVIEAWWRTQSAA